MLTGICDYPLKFQSAKTQYRVWGFFSWHIPLGTSRCRPWSRSRPRKKGAGATKKGHLRSLNNKPIPVQFVESFKNKHK